MDISARHPGASRSDLAPTRHGRAADVGCVCLLVLLAGLVLLLRNSTLPIQLWDESRNANNALEMSRNGHVIVTYFNGAPDHWNTKPPLLIWCMALLLRLGLPPLVAVRLPSIMAATATVLAVWTFWPKLPVRSARWPLRRADTTVGSALCGLACRQNRRLRCTRLLFHPALYAGLLEISRK